jgi:hypothetical protein
MCNFLSGVVTLERHPRVLCADLRHHEETVARYSLLPEQYREWECTLPDLDDLTVRAAPGENPNVLKSAILAKYDSFHELLNECINQTEAQGGYLYLRGCTLPDGLKLPDSVGGYLDLRLHAAARAQAARFGRRQGFTSPQSI